MYIFYYQNNTLILHCTAHVNPFILFHFTSFNFIFTCAASTKGSVSYSFTDTDEVRK